MRAIVVFCAMIFGSVCGQAAEQGLASFYGGPLAGGLTAAHRTLPFGSQVRIVNLDNGRAVVVRIVDRGPFIDGRIIDVSPAVATILGFRTAGLGHVRIDRISAETSEAGLPVLQLAAAIQTRTSSHKICRYGADRLEYVQTGSAVDFAGGARRGLGCVDLRSTLFAFAKSEDLTPLVARGGAFLTEMEAAASIPGSAVAAVPQTVPVRQAFFARIAPGASVAELAAAASIPASVLDAVPERKASSARPTGDCSGPTSCEKRDRPPASNPVSLFFAQLRNIFD